MWNFKQKRCNYRPSNDADLINLKADTFSFGFYITLVILNKAEEEILNLFC